MICEIWLVVDSENFQQVLKAHSIHWTSRNILVELS